MARVRVVTRGQHNEVVRPIESIEIRVREPELDPLSGLPTSELEELEEPALSVGEWARQFLAETAEPPAEPWWSRALAFVAAKVAGLARRVVAFVQSRRSRDPETLEEHIAELEELFGSPLPDEILTAVQTRFAFTELEALASERAEGELSERERVAVLLTMFLRIHPEHAAEEAALTELAKDDPVMLAELICDELGWTYVDELFVDASGN